MFWEFRKAVRVAEVSLSKMICDIGKDLDEKNSKTFFKGRNISRGRFGFHRVEINKTKMFGDENILVPFIRWDGKPVR
jgi:hypothetical protein